MVFRKLLVSALGLALAGTASANVDELVKQIHERMPVEKAAELSYSPATLLKAIQIIKKNDTAPECKTAEVRRNSYKFATGYNDKGEPCKIYDLSFVTAATLLKVASLPIMQFTSDDYLAWIDGDTDYVFKRIEAFQNDKSENLLAQSWFAKLDFKNKNLRRTTFSLAELNIPDNFSFTAEEKANLIQALRESGVPSTSSLYTMVDNPKNVLSKIKLKWDDVKKVFDIVLDFDFLPIKGPVHLVDYQKPYAAAVEKMIRSMVFKLLNYATKFIPEPTTKTIVQVVLSDVAQFLEMTYDNHLNALEDTLRLNLAGTVPTAIAAKDLTKGMNLLYATKSSLVTQYILSLVQGTTFSLDQLEKIGSDNRYQTEKQRKNLRANLNSDLVLNHGCKVTLYRDYFAVCAKNQSPYALYSLLSEQKVLIWNLGAPALHYHKFPVAIALERYTSWLLSMGARIAPIKVSDFIVNQLSNLLKKFATAGLSDEAFLLNSMTEMKYVNGAADAQAAYYMPYLYAQNIIPWDAKTEKIENIIIQANTKLLDKVSKGQDNE